MHHMGSGDEKREMQLSAKKWMPFHAFSSKILILHNIEERASYTAGERNVNVGFEERIREATNAFKDLWARKIKNENMFKRKMSWEFISFWAIHSPSLENFSCCIA